MYFRFVVTFLVVSPSTTTAFPGGRPEQRPTTAVRLGRRTIRFSPRYNVEQPLGRLLQGLRLAPEMSNRALGYYFLYTFLRIDV